MTKSMAKLEKVLQVMVNPRFSPARAQWPFRKAIVGLTEVCFGRATVDEHQLILLSVVRETATAEVARWWSREVPRATWQDTPWS